MPNVNYPLDTTGLLTSNLIVDELHTLTEVNANTYRILVPEFAPFYLDNFQLKYTDSTGNVTILQEGVDYVFCLPYIGASRSIAKMLYGAVSINDNIINGTLKIRYQTLGGDWTADRDYVLEAIAESVYNPRITVWDVVTNKPSLFPPINHDQSMDYIYGYQDLIDGINSLANTIATGPNPTNSVVSHILNTDNPHQVTKQQLGLGNIVDLPLATDQEVSNLDPVDKYVTFKQLVDSGLFNTSTTAQSDHLTETNNPHQVTKEQVGLGNIVNYELASDQEVIDRMLVDKYVTLRQIVTLIQGIESKIVSPAEMLYYSRSK